MLINKVTKLQFFLETMIFFLKFIFLQKIFNYAEIDNAGVKPIGYH